MRTVPIIKAQTYAKYLVMHDDDRHRPPVRRLIKRIVMIYDDHASVLAGKGLCGEN